MTTSKHYWLATAALLVGGTASQAADLPFRKAAPVDYVRICDVKGLTGFFYIPGTDTCLKITGQVRAEETFRVNAPTNTAAAFAYNQAGQVYRRDLLSFRGRGYLNADTRTQTAYGMLRAFVSLRLTDDSTAPGPVGGRGEIGVPGVPAGVRASTGLFQGLTPNAAQAVLDKGFIQFAGLTAGRTQSFFDFDAQSYELLTNTVANSNQVTEILAYTATFGGGFSATVSVEDSVERSIGDNGSFTFAGTKPLPAGGLGVNFGSQNNPSLSASGGLGQASVLAYGGESIPDIVANLRYEGEWGSAQISGAYHQLSSVPVARTTGTTAATLALVPGSTVRPTADGFAVLGGVKVLLPTLAKGDSVTVQGSYEEGAMDYVNPVNYTPVGLSNVYNSTTTGIAQSFSVPLNDAFVLTNGTIAKNRAWGVYGAFRHYFVPEVYGSLFGDYLDITNPIQAERIGASTDSARIWQIGGNVVWVPVKDFQIGTEALYTNLRYKVVATTAQGLTAAGLGTTPQEPDDYRVRLSIRRAF